MMKTILKSKNPKFELRHIRMSDAKAYWEVKRDKDSKRGFMHVCKNLNCARRDLKKYITGMKSKPQKIIIFAIIVEGKFAGFVDIHHLNEKYFWHKGELGYGILPEFRGKGLATAAVKIITDYGFKKLKLRRIEGYCRTFNKASAKVLEKAGYKLEGVLRKNKCKDGKYLDDMVWAKVK